MLQLLLYVIVMLNIQIFYGGPVMFLITCSIIHLSIMGWKMFPILLLSLQVALRPRFCSLVCVYAYTLQSIMLLMQVVGRLFFSSLRSFVFDNNTVLLVGRYSSIMLLSEFILLNAPSKAFWAPTSFSTKSFVLH